MRRKCSVSQLLESRLRRFALVLGCAALLLGVAGAQDRASVPTLIKFSGTISGAPAGSVGVIFALYADQTGGAPLWQEVQSVAVDASGHYAALLGSSSATGIPVGVFSNNEARWLGVQVQGQSEQARVVLVSVPYALKASDAQTLGGLPPTAFLRADSATTTATSSAATTATVNAAAASQTVSPALTDTGTKNYIPVFTDASGDLGNSGMYQLNGGTVANPEWWEGIGTTSPAFNLNVVSSSPADSQAAIDIDGYGVVGINFIGRRAEGTLAAPAGLLANDNIFAMQGRGWFQSGTSGVPSGFSGYSRAYMKFFAAEPWTDTAQGTYLSLATTTKGTAPNAAATERVRITDAGNVGIGTATPGGAASTTAPVLLEVNGSVKLTSGSSGSIVFQDGSTIASANTLASLNTTGNQIFTGNQYTIGSIGSTGDVNVDVDNLNNGSSLPPGLRFGNSSGEGIASNRVGGSSLYGLDFYTGSSIRMSIASAANGGMVGIGTQPNLPKAQLEADSTSATHPAGVLGSVGGVLSTLGAADSGFHAGVWGDIGGTNSFGSSGIRGTADDNGAGFFDNNSVNVPTLDVRNTETSSGSSILFYASGVGGDCLMDASGNLTCAGAVKGAVAVAGGARQVALYAMQSPENWFEDAGSGQLSGGSAHVEFDATFAQTVNGGVEYHVFLTPNGDCKGLYVSGKTARGFEVHELGGGRTSVAFDYRIMAKRVGYENVRLEDLTKQIKTQRERHKQLQHPVRTSDGPQLAPGRAAQVR